MSMGFERDFAAAGEIKHCVSLRQWHRCAVSSWPAEGPAGATRSFTTGAFVDLSSAMITHAGATVVSPIPTGDLTIDPAAIEAAITAPDGRHHSCDLYGQPRIDAIMDRIQTRTLGGGGLREAHLARYKGRRSALSARLRPIRSIGQEFWGRWRPRRHCDQ